MAGNSFDAIFAARRTLPAQSVLFPAVALSSYSRWLIPSMIPGASELIKTLLTQGDNPGKAVKDHVFWGVGGLGGLKETMGLLWNVCRMQKALQRHRW